MSICRGCGDVDPSRALGMANVLAAAYFRVQGSLTEAASAGCESTTR